MSRWLTSVDYVTKLSCLWAARWIRILGGKRWKLKDKSPERDGRRIARPKVAQLQSQSENIQGALSPWGPLDNILHVYKINSMRKQVPEAGKYQNREN